MISSTGKTLYRIQNVYDHHIVNIHRVFTMCLVFYIFYLIFISNISVRKVVFILFTDEETKIKAMHLVS